MFQLAAMIAKHEGLEEDNIDQWIENGLLPKNFGHRADGSLVTHRNGTYYDSLRGKRGYFAPIPDMEIEQVTEEEACLVCRATRILPTTIAKIRSFVRVCQTIRIAKRKRATCD